MNNIRPINKFSLKIFAATYNLVLELNIAPIREMVCPFSKYLEL